MNSLIPVSRGLCMQGLALETTEPSRILSFACSALLESLLRSEAPGKECCASNA